MPFCTKCGARLEDGDVFCGVCGAAVPLADIVDEDAETEAAPEDTGEEPRFEPEPEPVPEFEVATPAEREAVEREVKKDGVKRCPACGEIVGLNDFVCGACGHELRRVTDGSINELYRRLEALEAGRAQGESKNDEGVSKTDALKANAIRYYPIPNTKQDLLEFLVMARANSQEGNKEYEEVVLDAWRSKFGQAYDKAEALFGDDEDFSKFEKIRSRFEKPGNRNKSKNDLEQDRIVAKMFIAFFGLLMLSCTLMTIFG